MAPYCLFEWDGITWNKIEDHCPEGEKCEEPAVDGGTPVGAWRFVFCVPG